VKRIASVKNLVVVLMCGVGVCYVFWCVLCCTLYVLCVCLCICVCVFCEFLCVRLLEQDSVPAPPHNTTK
jgi:hypothetical protein